MDKGFTVVGISVDTDETAALAAFFAAVDHTVSKRTAFVVARHLSCEQQRVLREAVSRQATMQLVEVGEATPINFGFIYFAAPNSHIVIDNGVLQPLVPAAGWMPVDAFLRSLAEDQHEHSVAIVLSGKNNDGALGVRAIKGEGGLVMVQEPDSCEHDTMPYSTIATGIVDFVLPPDKMPGQLAAYLSHIDRQTNLPPPSLVPQSTDILKKICLLLRTHTGHDFSQYKENTLARRIERRMAIRQLDHGEDYLHYLHQNPPEIDMLFHDLLIGVTNFFRDPEAFAALQSKILPRLFSEKNTRHSVRVWVCGCSTGEEAYSIAILLQEYLDNMKQACKLQIFATDIDKRAIEQARRGIFPASIAADVSSERLRRFFVHDTQTGGYRIHKCIRDLVVFSEQDVIKDPPFSKIDLVSCRNLLIYLNSELQRKLIPLFHYSLNPAGILFLGPSETIGDFSERFAVLDHKWKFYLRKEDVAAMPRIAPSAFVPPLLEYEERLRQFHHNSDDTRKLDLHALTEHALLQHYNPVGILVNGRGDIQHIYGRSGQYLEPAPGDTAVNILPMAREGLRRELTTALHKSVANKEPVHYHRLRVKTNGDTINVDLTVRPVSKPGSGAVIADMFLVVLQESTPDAWAPGEFPATGDGTSTDQRIAALEQEIHAKEEYLQVTLEEMESAAEEFKSINEEMQSVNEELQSTNEELETSKEELQSVNEELATVNSELQSKVADLSRSNNDMNNLLASTGGGALFVDHQLRIARFTPATTQLINLIQSDIGRTVAHIVCNLEGYDHLVEDVNSVLDTLAPKEAEVKTKNGMWYLMRIRPYRTNENVIEGAVITFVDITLRKQAEEALRHSERRLRSLFNGGIIGMGYWGPNGEVIEANDAYLAIIGCTREELVKGAINWQNLTPPEHLEADRRAIAEIIANGRCTPYEKEYHRADGTRVPVLIGGMLVEKSPLLGVAFALDITARKKAEQEQKKLAEQLAQAQKMESVGRLAGGVAHDFNNMLEVILGNTELALEQVDAALPLHSDLLEIQEAARHSADLTRQLLAFARKQPVLPKVMHLNETVADMLKMLVRLIGENIDLLWVPGKNLWPVCIDPSQFDQIVTNLCINARDAIVGSGKITVLTRNVILGESDIGERERCKPGDYVLLAVSDNGCGMDQETLSHLFEPFFTTKPYGRNTGMGLATLYGIVQQNDGFILVESVPHQGTTFFIYLPRCENGTEIDKTEVTEENTQANGETVLLVEDSPAVLKLGHSMLHRLGYQVLTASDPEEAIRKAESHVGKIHLLITDVVMPLMNGCEMAKRVRLIKPEVKCLFMSGYPTDTISSHGVIEPDIHFIAKPFTIKELAPKIRHTLAAPASFMEGNPREP